MRGPKYKEKYVCKDILRLNKVKKGGLDYRFSLEITLNKEGNESISVIMMNPSKADGEYSDKSVNRVIKYVYENEEELRNVNKIYILNLYPVYETYSRKFTELYEKYSEEQLLAEGQNDEEIKRIVSMSNKVIVGWGLASGLNKINEERYRNRCCELFELIERNNNNIFCAGSLTKKGYVRHLGRNRNLYNSKLYRVGMRNEDFIISSI